jgi:hypothetical protein
VLNVAEEGVNLLWDIQTDQFISSLEQPIKESKNVSLRDMLTNPSKYYDVKGINDTISDIKKITTDYFDGILSNLTEERKKLDNELESADVQYKKISEVISNKATSSNVPYIKPFAVEINQDIREEIILDQYNNEADALLGKLASGSMYIADVSGSYNNHTLGSWLFSSNKPYLVTLRPPSSLIVIIERSMNNILNMLNNIAPTPSQ